MYEYHVVKAKISSLVFHQRDLLEKEASVARAMGDVDYLYEVETNLLNLKFDIATTYLGESLGGLFLRIEAGVESLRHWPTYH